MNIYENEFVKIISFTVSNFSVLFFCILFDVYTKSVFDNLDLSNINVDIILNILFYFAWCSFPLSDVRDNFRHIIGLSTHSRVATFSQIHPLYTFWWFFSYIDINYFSFSLALYIPLYLSIYLSS